MKRIIRFQSTRYYFFTFSICLAIAGLLGYFLNRGLNLGVDFRAGVALQFQIAPAAFSLTYTGPDKATIDVPSGSQALTAAGDFIITEVAPDGTSTSTPFKWADYKTVQQFTEALARVSGIAVEMKGFPDADPKQLVPLVRPADITGAPYTLNLQPEPERGVQARMADVRTALATVGTFDLQQVGPATSQEFIARVQAMSDDPAFKDVTQKLLVQLLGKVYGADQVILKSADFVGPKMARSLGVQAVWLVIIALILIEVYMAFRFKPIYAVAAVLALVHDAMVMLGFSVIFRVEIDAGTIAAILTILGYSINDTIVIFDRVRENQTLMRESGLEPILDASVTQTLGRTVITSGATMMTVLALFLLTSGTMKNFGLLMIVGIIEGTYSTVFIASPIVLEWENLMARRRKRLGMQKYGVKAAEPRAAEKREIEAEEEMESEEEAGGIAVGPTLGATPVPLAPLPPLAGDALDGAGAMSAGVSGEASAGSDGGGAPAAPGQAAQKPAIPPGRAAAPPQPVTQQPGSPYSSDRHRRHKRRRHH